MDAGQWLNKGRAAAAALAVYGMTNGPRQWPKYGDTIVFICGAIMAVLAADVVHSNAVGAQNARALNSVVNPPLRDAATEESQK